MNPQLNRFKAQFDKSEQKKQPNQVSNQEAVAESTEGKPAKVNGESSGSSPADRLLAAQYYWVHSRM